MKKTFKASYTVEASLLFPFILAVTVLLIYFSFLIHDRTVMDAAANQAAIRGSEITSPDGDIFSKVQDTGKRETEGRLLATKNVDMDISVDGKEVRVEINGDFEIPRGVIPVPGFSIGNTDITVCAHSSRIDPAGFIRECRVIEEHTGNEKSKGKDR